MLCATDAQGKLLAVVLDYACHGTTLGGDFNRIHGDWPGVAQELIEAEHPGATALVCLGCAGDANPDPRGKLEMTRLHGRAVADEVNRLLRGKLAPVCPSLIARHVPLQLPFQTPPAREELQRRLAAAKDPKATSLEKALGVQAAAWLARLDRGCPMPSGIDYSVTTWTFGNDLAMVFLPGEVVVDYALRLKRELDASRLWVTAYANDVPCYIVSRRVLAEGGYEPDFSMIYYDRPSRLAPSVEDRIIDAVRSIVPESFDAVRAQPLSQRLRALPFKIAWERYADDNSDIFVMDADGEGAKNLTQTPTQQEHYPQISPDGTKICFTVDSGEDRDTVRSLWVMDIDGKNRRKIADHAREPFWAPDGKTIGYLPQEFPKFNVIDYYTKGMVFCDLESGRTEPHVNSAALHHLYNPSYASNGKWIAATVHAGMGFDHAILLIEAHGKRIIDLKIPGCRPCLSPDGRHIAWGADDHELAIAPLDLDSPQPSVGAWSLHIEDEHNKIYHIDWSPDSRFVAFSRGPEGDGDLSKPGTFQAACEIVGVYAKGWNLCAVSARPYGILDLNQATDRDFVQLTSDGASNKEPAWFRANRPAKEQLP
jgi:dipeptidyl aminopeptidase/acylaminoacyl peptidase